MTSVMKLFAVREQDPFVGVPESARCKDSSKQVPYKMWFALGLIATPPM